MNRCSILPALFAVVSLLTPVAAKADVSLAADLVAGAESSSASPIGRVSQGLLIVAKSQTGETDLLIAREPSGSIEKVTTLNKATGVTSTNEQGVFFSIPAGLPGAGSNWFSDGTAQGTVPVPFSKSALFQRSGSEVLYTYAYSYDLGRYNMATGLNEPVYVNAGPVTVYAVIGGVPIGIQHPYVYQWNFSTKSWQYLGSIGWNSMKWVYSGRNNDRLYAAGVEQISDSTFVHYVYRVEPNLIQRVKMLSAESQRHSIPLTDRWEGATRYWAFTMTTDYGTTEYYNIEPVVTRVESYDQGYTHLSVPNTLLVSGGGFSAHSGRLYSISQMGREVPHEPLTWQQENIEVNSLRVVGDTVLIFGSTPSQGAEVWSVPVDSCPNDTNKLYAGSCGCGVADTDTDRDGTPDCFDLCASDPTKIAKGACGCGQPDVDPDGDGTMSCIDLCPEDANKVDQGACGCGVADTDSDGDGTANCNDRCANDAKKTAPGVCGCGIVDVDSDLDGIMDCNDPCSSNTLKINPGVCGCNIADTDTDHDGTPDCIDSCAFNNQKVGAGVCGCGVSDTDSDGDLSPDCVDECPQDKSKTRRGLAGCGLSDTDTDGDSTPDALDQCPADTKKTAPGVCGCNATEQDNDSDGIADCVDECSTDSSKAKAGVCGCGVADTDSDNDGTADCFDLCPNEPTLTQPVAGSCQRAVTSSDLCPLDAAKLSPGACGCGIADTDVDRNGVVDCFETRLLSVVSPTVDVRYVGKTPRLLISMSNVEGATYQVEATRLDRKAAKIITKTVRSASAMLTGISSKSRWSVRYRVISGGISSGWSTPTQVRVK